MTKLADRVRDSLKISDVRYLGEKIPMSETDSDIYRCEVWFIFCTVYVCFVLFPIHVTAVKCIPPSDYYISAH